MKKQYVLDTNLPVYDPQCIYKFDDNDLTFSTITLRELDGLKSRNNESGRNAREFTRMLDELSDRGDINDGIALTNELGQQLGSLKFEPFDIKILEDIKNKFGEINNDDKILSVAIKEKVKTESIGKEIQKKIEDLNTKKKKTPDERKEIKLLKEELSALKPVILVSKDVNLRVRAKAFGITVQDYKNDKIYNKDKIYKGWQVIQVKDDLIADYYLEKYEQPSETFNDEDEYGKALDVAKYGINIEDYGFMPNEYAVLVGTSHGSLTDELLEKLYEIKDNNSVVVLKYNSKTGKLHMLNDYSKWLNEYNIVPRNIQQRILIDMMFDRRKPFKSINGIAGTGKTLLALLCSIVMVNDLKWFDEILITRAIVPMEEDIGYLPGDEQQKIEPYMRSFLNNLKVITYKKQKNNKAENLSFEMSMYHIRAVAPTYLRGNTLPRTILLQDEAQNATKHFMKTICTRIGEDSMIVSIGDIDQIDHPYLDSTNCGLSYAIEMMKDEEIAEHCTLVLGERSELASIVAKKWK